MQIKFYQIFSTTIVRKCTLYINNNFSLQSLEYVMRFFLQMFCLSFVLTNVLQMIKIGESFFFIIRNAMDGLFATERRNLKFQKLQLLVTFCLKVDKLYPSNFVFDYPQKAPSRYSY